ncbi:MAG: hypothetical protein WA090_00510, partial [Candidatus Nanopelagicaceae bacterium]
LGLSETSGVGEGSTVLLTGSDVAVAIIFSGRFSTGLSIFFSFEFFSRLASLTVLGFSLDSLFDLPVPPFSESVIFLPTGFALPVGFCEILACGTSLFSVPAVSTFGVFEGVAEDSAFADRFFSNVGVESTF